MPDRWRSSVVTSDEKGLSDDIRSVLRRMWRRIGCLVCLCATFVLSASSARSARPDLLTTKIILPAQQRSAVFCEVSNHGDTIESFYSHIVAGERYAALIDPSACVSSPQYPFEVTTVWLTLLTFSKAVWPVPTIHLPLSIRMILKHSIS